MEPPQARRLVERSSTLVAGAKKNNGEDDDPHDSLCTLGSAIWFPGNGADERGKIEYRTGPHWNDTGPATDDTRRCKDLRAWAEPSGSGWSERHRPGCWTAQNKVTGKATQRT